MGLWRRLRGHRGALALALLLLGSALVFRAHRRGIDRATGLDRAVLALTAPVQRLLVSVVGFGTGLWRSYVDVLDARAEADGLRERLGEAERRLASLEVAAIENEHLRALLGFEARNPDHRLVAARVIGAGLDPGVSVLRIDKGALHGLRRGQPVVSGQGLVGRILSAAWTTAEVQLVADPRVSVAAVVQRTGARGRLRGQGRADFLLLLSEVLRSDDLAPGDTVTTSGLSGVFPAGLTLGSVTRIFHEEGFPRRLADIAPAVDFARIGAVEVVLTPEPTLPLVTPEPLLPPALEAQTPRPTAPADSPWPP